MVVVVLLECLECPGIVKGKGRGNELGQRVRWSVVALIYTCV